MTKFIVSSERFRRIQAVADGEPVHPDDREVLKYVLEAFREPFSGTPVSSLLRVVDLPPIGSTVYFHEERFEDGPTEEQSATVVGHESEGMIEVEYGHRTLRRQTKLIAWHLTPVSKALRT